MSPKEQLTTTASHLRELSYYQLLAVRPDAPLGDLRRAFQQFALRYHPDQFMDEDDATRALATKIYQRGVEAYTVLRNEVTAKAYRENVKRGRLRLSPMQRSQAIRDHTQRQSPRPVSKPAPPPDVDAFWRKMKTDDGRQVARRVEKLLAARRFREAYLQLGLLETIEPNNKAVTTKADRLSRYMKKRGI
jgi:hypothetical protein